MADAHVVTLALSELLRRQGDQGVSAVRGEVFFHLAQLLDLVAECVETLCGDGELAERVRSHARRYRDQGRAILGGVA